MLIKTLILTAVLFGYCPEKPDDLSCFEQAMHSHYEKAYKDMFFEVNQLELAEAYEEVK